MNDKIVVRLNTGDGYAEIEGDFDLVKKLVEPYLDGKVVTLGGESAAPALSKNAGVAETQVENGAKPLDLVQFYLKMSPQSQNEQVLVIAHFYQHYRQMADLSLDDYEEAYRLLQKVPVPKPGNLKSTVRNVVDRTDLLRNSERGRFMLTMKGEEFVRQMTQR